MSLRKTLWALALLGVAGWAPAQSFDPYVTGPNASESQDLCRLNLATGEVDVIGSLGIQHVYVSAMTFHQDGLLYAVASAPATGPSLITVDLSSGAATVIGPLGVSINDVDLTVDDNGVMWMLDDLDLYVIDPDTGAATLDCAQQGQVSLMGLAERSGQTTVLQRWPETPTALDCGLTPATVDLSINTVWWLDTGPDDRLYALRSWCDQWDCLYRWSKLVRYDATDTFTVISEIDGIMLSGLAFPPAPEVTAEPVPTLAPWALAMFCAALAAAGMLTSRLRR